MEVKFYPQYNNHIQTFKSNEDVYHDKNGKITNRTVTYFFRTDLDWMYFAKLLNNKYKKEPNFNLIQYACSDGSEAYTTAMAIKEFAPDIKEKAFPIIALDKFDQVVKEAQSGICNLYEDDISAIDWWTRGKFNDYFQVVPRTNPDCAMGVKPKFPLEECIIFNQANVLEDLKNIPNKNTVIMCRNCWEYIGRENYDKLAKELYEVTKDNGLLVIGDHDELHGVPPVLLQNGFRETSVKRVYEPIKKVATK